ncbi:phage tail tape measure protein [Wolbachia endosymbiont of Tribolium confusum]|uniref:phage tail tape measure protein n=1 Tax=Wolbachia endosymbiont of Tribolium confusum TaxID=214474 RepID=UPI001CF4CA11|nr:phage tail tape measure protein [Wolbachia endosymbiont of Tribolium confusum]MCA7010478.1 phage tail tape measure protein [Wolbachia endosymbiont of Tribolium confusum]
MSTLSVKIGAILDGSFNSAMAGSSAQLSRLGGTIRQLDASMKSVSKFKELSSNTLVAKRSWKGLEVQVTSLAKQMKTTEKPSKDLKAQFDKAKESAIKAKTAYLQKRDTLHMLSEEFKKSGKNIQSLIRDQDKLGASANRLRSQYSKLNSAIKKRDMFLGRKAHFKSQILETAGLALTLAAPIKVAIDYESVMADIRAVMKFSKEKEANDRGFMELGQGIKELSRTIPLSAAELAQITTSGARLGIEEKKDLLEFTEIVSKMAVNFGMSVEEIGSAASKLYSIYGMSLEDLKDLGNLANHIASNTTVEAKDLMAGMNIASGAAKQFGLKIEQTAGLVSAFISLGKQPKKAAEMINAVLVKLQTAREQGDEFIGTLDEIGIDIEELEENIKKDPQKALLSFFETLEKIDKDERPNILLKLFGLGSQDEVALMLGSLGEWRNKMKLLANEEERQNSLQEEFNDRVSTTANQLRLLKNSVAEVSMNLGSVMLPILKPIAEKLKWASENVASFAEKYPTVTKVIMGTIAALIGLKVLAVAGGYAFYLARSSMSTFSIILHGVLKPALISLATYAIPAVITGLSVLKATTLSLATKAFPLLSSVLPAVVTGLRAITLAVISNPIGLLIAGLITGAAFIITNWQKVKNFFSSIWEYIKSIIKPIGEMFSWLGNTVGSIFGKVAENSPLKEFEKRKSIVAEIKTVHTPLKSGILSNGNPLLNNSIIKEISKRNKSFIEEKKSIEGNQVNEIFEKNRFEKKESKTYSQIFHQTFNINVKAEPNQDARSIADAVMERFREQARGALFDTVEEMY